VLNKVPEVTVFFWVIKVLTTTVGRTERRGGHVPAASGAAPAGAPTASHLTDE
jgi:uncharacterized membrane-anchored protein